LSHTKVSKLKEILEYIQSRTNVPVCLDTEGAQVRTGDFAEGKITVLENSTLRVPFHRVSGDSGNLNLYPEEIARQLIVGDLLKIDAEVLAQVVAIENDCVVLWVLNGGEIGQNKAVSLLERDLTMPAVTEKDKQALRIGNEMGIRHVALSFANRARDVEEVRALASKDAIVVSKIECLSGLRNLPEIAAQSGEHRKNSGRTKRHHPLCERRGQKNLRRHQLARVDGDVGQSHPRGGQRYLQHADGWRRWLGAGGRMRHRSFSGGGREYGQKNYS
jgi:pyruvate kinase